jgi:hypothetical protein
MFLIAYLGQSDALLSGRDAHLHGHDCTRGSIALRDRVQLGRNPFQLSDAVIEVVEGSVVVCGALMCAISLWK